MATKSKGINLLSSVCGFTLVLLWIILLFRTLRRGVGSENNLMKTTGKSGIFLSSRRRNWCAIHGNYLLWEMIS